MDLQVCDTCTVKPKGCAPTWHINNKTVSVRCMNCVNGKRGCSFRDCNFGIGKYPKLRKTKAGDARRADQTMSKYKVAPKKIMAEDDLALIRGPTPSLTVKGKERASIAPGMMKSVSEGIPSPLETVFDGAEDQTNEVPATTPEPGQITQQKVSIPSSWSRPSGRSERIFFEDILRFEKELSSSGRSSLSLNLASAEVRTIAAREKMQADAVALFTADRQPLMEKLAKRLDAASVLMEEQEVGLNLKVVDAGKDASSIEDKNNGTEGND